MEYMEFLNFVHTPQVHELGPLAASLPFTEYSVQEAIVMEYYGVYVGWNSGDQYYVVSRAGGEGKKKKDSVNLHKTHL